MITYRPAWAGNDDTEALQQQILAGAGGTVVIARGSYWIDAVTGLLVPPNTYLILDGVLLYAIPTASPSYEILKAGAGCTIQGGELVGDRYTHMGTSGEFGHGIAIREDGVTVLGTVTRDMWGDGIYISTPGDVELEGVVSVNNRRQGMSVIACGALTARNCEFAETGGTRPQHGVDIEPEAGHTANQLLFEGCVFRNNVKFGLVVNRQAGGSVGEVIVSNCLYYRNLAGEYHEFN